MSMSPMELQKKTEYFSDWEKVTSGVIKAGYKDAKNDFALTHSLGGGRKQHRLSGRCEENTMEKLGK